MIKTILKTISLLAVIVTLTACQPQNAPPRSLLYLGWDDANLLQLFIYSEQRGETTQLTFAEQGVAAYALSPDATRIAYTTSLSDTAVSQLHLLTLTRSNRATAERLLYTCKAHCSRLAWGPDGVRLLFEQRPYRPDSTILGAPLLWWLDVQSGEAIPVVPGEERGHAAGTLSPNGAWVTYSVPAEERLYAYDFESGRYYITGSVLGSLAAWHPNGGAFVISDLDPVLIHGSDSDDHAGHWHEYEEAIHLFWVDPNNEQRSRLTDDPGVDDAAPLFSPSGEWLLFGRRPIRTSAGRQLYLLNVTSGELKRLTHDLNMHHGAASWSENGAFLLYQAVDTREANPKPSIWRMNLSSAERVLLVPEGVLPSWLD